MKIQMLLARSSKAKLSYDTYADAFDDTAQLPDCPDGAKKPYHQQSKIPCVG